MSWRCLQLLCTSLVQGPRLCEYTGGLFCRRCHLGRTARLPARALHSWDFNPRPGG
jgi:Putative zinc-RING and/or ribbon